MKQAVKDSSGLECVEVTCKAKPSKLNLCEKHYSEFKFGAIKKNGTHPIDRDKKLVHFEKHKGSY